jgi:DNA-binding protein H-NS
MLPFFEETTMTRPKSLANMSLEALIELRDRVTEALNERAAGLQKQISSLTGGNGSDHVGKRSSALKGRKVAAKYRSKKDAKRTWAGRGATPRWMREEMKAGKLKKEAFLIR